MQAPCQKRAEPTRYEIVEGWTIGKRITKWIAGNDPLGLKIGHVPKTGFEKRSRQGDCDQTARLRLIDEALYGVYDSHKLITLEEYCGRIAPEAAASGGQRLRGMKSGFRRRFFLKQAQFFQA